jgi:hypothetical protein
MAGMEKRRANRLLVRVPRLILLVAIALFYLQFGLQALTQFLALVGAIALGRGAVRSYRGHSVLAIVFIGTVPLLLLHAVMTLLEPGELPFLIGSAPVPVLAGAVWLITGSSRSHN